MATHLTCSAQQSLGRQGLLTMTITTDPSTGFCVYRLGARRVSGTVTLHPGTATYDPSAPKSRSWRTDLLILPGTEVGASSLRWDRLNVHGVELAGPIRINFERFDEDRYICVSRRDKNGRSIPPPYPTEQLGKQVLAAVVDHWRGREDRADLEAAARLSKTPYWLHQHRQKLKDQEEELQKLHEQMARTTERIAVLETLLQDGARS